MEYSNETKYVSARYVHQRLDSVRMRSHRRPHLDPPLPRIPFSHFLSSRVAPVYLLLRAQWILISESFVALYVSRYSNNSIFTSIFIFLLFCFSLQQAHAFLLSSSSLVWSRYAPSWWSHSTTRKVYLGDTVPTSNVASRLTRRRILDKRTIENVSAEVSASSEFITTSLR